jgi:hypothetical protein
MVRRRFDAFKLPNARFAQAATVDPKMNRNFQKCRLRSLNRWRDEHSEVLFPGMDPSEDD